MQLEQTKTRQVTNGTDCQDWHRDPSPPVPAADEDEQEETDCYTLPGGIILETKMAENTDNAAHTLHVDDGDDEADVQDSSASVYALSTYPKVQPAYQVEQPYENGLDGATMCVTLQLSIGSYVYANKGSETHREHCTLKT